MKVLLFLSLSLSLSLLLGGAYGIITEDQQKSGFEAFFRNVSFIHIPKNGGSTMEKTIMKMSGVQFGYAAYQRHSLFTTPKTWQINTSLFCPPTPRGTGCSRTGLCAQNTCAFWHIPPYTYREPYHSTLVKDLRFCHIRNPFTRSVSETLYIHSGLKKKPVEKVLSVYLPVLDALRSNKGNEINVYRKIRYHEGNPSLLPVNATPHPAHVVPAVSLSPSSPSLVIPFPKMEENEQGNELLISPLSSLTPPPPPSPSSSSSFPKCYMNPHQHCHHIPESRFVEPFVTANYIQDLYYYLEKTDKDCIDILRILEGKHSTELTRSTGLNCNFPLRFEWYAHDFNLLLQRCGPFPDYVHPGNDTPDEKYMPILAVQKVKEKLQELFWEDALRFGYNEYPL